MPDNVGPVFINGVEYVPKPSGVFQCRSTFQAVNGPRVTNARCQGILGHAGLHQYTTGNDGPYPYGAGWYLTW